MSEQPDALDKCQWPTCGCRIDIGEDWMACRPERGERRQDMSKHEPVYAFRRKGLDDFCTCDKRRYDELAEKSDVFEVAIFYAAPLQRSEQDTALLRQALEALESCRPGDWSIGGVIQQGFDEKAVDAAETALRVALEGKT